MGLLGSAPHMRGIPRRTKAPAPPVRISPAHAGNTGGGGGSAAPSPDQPRTCGEYHSPARTGLTGMGSAPHMRGIHPLHDVGGQRAGISPAHAGNTPATGSLCDRNQDQPRTCGEYLAVTSWDDATIGSAPHMRGILRAGGSYGVRWRISPAHAGNTCPGPGR